MDTFGIIFILLSILFIFFLPRRFLFIPLICSCYGYSKAFVIIGSLHFTTMRVVIIAGLIRILVRREKINLLFKSTDKLMLYFSMLILFFSFFHHRPFASFVFRSGLVIDYIGCYLIMRFSCQTIDEITFFLKTLPIVLLPIAGEMVYEKISIKNIFAKLYGINAIPVIRDNGGIRSQGPFGHSILAGTVGAVCLPLMLGLPKISRKLSIFGTAICLTIIITSNSSGPILSALVGIASMCTWLFRNNLRLIRWAIGIAYIGLDLAMNRPAYFIVSDIDISGGSTGWHRARLIQSAFDHINEWWFSGTDYTRHWMPTGVSWSPNHTDITNFYLSMGIMGGLPLMLVFIYIFYKSFKILGLTIDKIKKEKPDVHFMLFALGASLMVHAVTCLSVSYFDQSVMFLFLLFSLIASANISIFSKIDD